VASRYLMGVVKQKVGNFYLLGFVEDHKQIYFSCQNLLHFFLHVHDPSNPLGVNVFCPTY